MDKDITRLAVERALRIASAVKEDLKRQIFTGPSQVRLTPAEFERRLAAGNTRLLRNAVSSLDDEQLTRLIAGAAARRSNNA